MRSADWFSGSNYRRARGQRENRANTQSALLWGRGPGAFGPRWREAAKATGWPGQRAQAPPRRSPQRRLSLGEQGETSTRFRSTKFQLIQSRHLRGEKREAPALGRGPLSLGRKRPRRARHGIANFVRWRKYAYGWSGDTFGYGESLVRIDQMIADIDPPSLDSPRWAKPRKH
jgi:hypothetical protein